VEDPSTLVGRTLGEDRYVLSGVLGEGSQGATFEAVDKREGRAVAIKRFVVRGARSWKDVELAEREAEVLGRLDHRLLPAALDRFEEDGALYLVMDRIEGPTLAHSERMTRDDVIRFLEDAAEVLDYLHRQAPPVIHRDLKPHNIIRRPAEGDRSESYVLVDFGSVRQKLEPKGGSTVVGTFGYMAPEQLQGRALPATDVYAVGATALRLLTGKEPEELPHRGLGIDVAAALGPGDPAMVRVLERMVAPDPDQRASAIGPLLAELGAAPEGQHTEPAPGPRPTMGRSDRRRARRRERRHQRAERRARRVSKMSRKLPFFVLPLVVLTVVLLRVALTLGIQILLPTALTLLSLIFGRGLRDRARDVATIGKQLDDNLARIQSRIASPSETSAPPEAEAEPRAEDAHEPTAARIDVNAEAKPRRIAPDDVEEAVEELEASMEELFEDLQTQLSGRRRR